MLSGALNKENLTNALRAVSQKRRSGVLEVRGEEDAYQVLLQSGKVSAVSKRGEPVRQAAIDRLVRLGLIEPADGESLSIQESETFIRACRVAQLDLLEEIWRLGGGRFEVHSQPFADEGLAPLNISPMQLLIDLAEDDLARQSLVKQGGAKRLEGLIFQALKLPGTHNADERAVLSALKDPCGFDELSQMVLQTRVDLRATLIRLSEEQSISISTPDAGSAKRGDVARRSGIIERNVSSEAIEAVQFDDPGDLAERWRMLIEADDRRGPLERSMHEQAANQEEMVEPEAPERVEPALVPEPTSETGEASEDRQAAPQIPFEEAPPDEASIEADLPPLEPEPVRLPTSEIERGRTEPPGREPSVAAARRLNLSLLDPSRRPLIAAGMVVLYLMILGYFAPPMLEGWFSALNRLILEG